MIDTHCHLTDERLFTQIDDVLARARAFGVMEMITICTKVSEASSCISVCEKYPQVRCTVGIHPNYAASATTNDAQRLADFVTCKHVVAMGEMGLDYFHKDTAPAHQADILRAQLSVAQDANMPVVVHCRDAVDDCLRILGEFPRVAGVFHCFTGTVDEARRIIDAGYLIGFTGPVTFKKSDALREAARLVPDDRLLIETDAPYLTPEPMRKQKVNEPGLVVHVARTLARERGVSFEEIDRITTENARRFFRSE